ncbi:Uncharacterised protein [Shigella sonnei]|nr:Uncharacterised protein [Shigella sonnei]CSR26815.1 Uncharacterised protein [Shigella sonnei]
MPLQFVATPVICSTAFASTATASSAGKSIDNICAILCWLFSSQPNCVTPHQS